MSSGIIITGLAIAAAGFTGRYLLRNRQLIRKTITISDSGMFSKYYKGGFEKRMTRSEAALILGGRNILGQGVGRSHGNPPASRKIAVQKCNKIKSTRNAKSSRT